MKYVFLAREDGKGIERLLCCCAPVTHGEMAEAHAKEGYKPVSAGFFKVKPDGSVETFGSSSSLKIGPRPNDANRIYHLTQATITLGSM